MTEPSHVSTSRFVYDRTASQYVDAIGVTITDRTEALLDRAMLDAFAAELAALAPGIVLDVGCGPGRAAKFLSNALGESDHDIRGIDIAPAMIDAAREAHPHLQFDVGSLTHLNVPTGSVAGAVYWYSIITTPLTELHHVWRELTRALAPSGEVLIAFQAGSDTEIARTNAYGSGADLTLHHHAADSVIASLESEGFTVHARSTREPQFDHETSPQAFLFARRRIPTSG